MNATHPVRRSPSASSPVGDKYLAASKALRDLRRLRPILTRAASHSPLPLPSLRAELERRFGVAVTISEAAHICRLHLPEHHLQWPPCAVLSEAASAQLTPIRLPSIFAHVGNSIAWARDLCDSIAAPFAEVRHVSIDLDENASLDGSIDRRPRIHLSRVAGIRDHSLQIVHEHGNERETEQTIRVMMCSGFTHQYGEPQSLLYYHEGASHLASVILWPAPGADVGAETIEVMHEAESAITGLLAARIAIRQARNPQCRASLRATEHAARRWRLTSRQRDVLCLLIAGRSPSQIAETLSIALSTVQSHVSALHALASVSSTQQLLAAALGPYE
jgi:DNA-binding CsgD family transcriptional regulator